MLDAEGHVKLVDFGLCKEGVHSPTEGASSLCGTAEYFAPEVLDRRGHGQAADWWNLGMVAYEMLTGLPPWYTPNTKLLFRSIRYEPLRPPRYMGARAVSLVESLLTKDPHQRLGSGPDRAQEVQQHAFFQGVDWPLLLARSVTPPLHPTRGQGELDARNFEK
ncbi:kinase-like domain-containing protein, partial [Ochromonadaceae sp. CCMP2298]